MSPEEAAKLRAPFPPEVVGKLPGSAGRPPLDYVGHAATTDRLLQVDPDWTWEPPTGDELQRLPNGDGMWIKLTVCGVTRFGWGDGKNMKEWIGDAIRNAAMRFGVALDLWSKEDLHASENAGVPGHGASAAQARPSGRQTGAPAPTPLSGAGESGSNPDRPSATSPHVAPAAPTASKSRVAQLQSKLIAMQADGFKVAPHRSRLGLPPLNDECSDADLDSWAALLNEQDSNLAREVVA